MKLYFHIYLGVAYDHGIITAVLEECTDSKLSVKSCLKQVTKELNNEMKIDVNVNAAAVFNSKDKQVSDDTKIDELADSADLIVKVSDDANKSKVKFEKTLITKDEVNKEPGKTQKVSDNAENQPETVLGLKNATKYLAKKRRDLALAEYKSILDEKPGCFDALFGVAYIYFSAKRYKSSLPYFEKVISKDSSDDKVLLDYSLALLESGDSTKAVNVASRCMNDLKRTNQPVEKIHTANVRLAEILGAMGQQPHAFQIYLSISQMTDKQHLDALLGYARVGYQMNHVTLDDVFIVVLNAVAQRKNDKKVLSFFTEMVQQEGGYEALGKQMHVAWNDAPAVVYIAKFLRDYGALKECMALLKHAFSLVPNSIDTVLLKVHVHENMCSTGEALKFVAEFCDGKLDRHVIRKIDLSSIVKALQFLLNGENDRLEELLVQSLAPEKEKKTPSPTGAMADLELQLLAVYFTVVKVCFVMGHLKVIPLFVKLLDPLFKMNNDLHQTLIRNEQAYYSCISQIYDACPVTIPSGDAEKFYFVGDSHVLPAAWRTVIFKDKLHVLHPVLTTGLKIWHLRKESKFYTKLSFESSIKKVPNGAACIFALGEIDCREGIDIAVEKCLYDSKQECVNALVDIYTKLLLDLQRSRKLKIFVHPVPPVLNATRANVQLFNEVLKGKVMKTPKLTWLDLLEELVDEEKKLKGDFEFDGVHLHPKYVELLENSLQGCV